MKLGQIKVFYAVLQIKKRGLGRQISNDYKCETGGVNEGQL